MQDDTSSTRSCIVNLANLPMLPRLMLVTDRHAMRPDFLSAIRAALRGGACLIQLREKDLPRAELETLAREATKLCAEYCATLLLNSHRDLANELNIGAHWPERFLRNIEYSMSEISFGVSVHSVQSAQRAQQLGARYVVFGSVFPTTSHPNETPAGIEKLREIVANVSIPVYAIGGIDSVDSIRACLETGAHGVAVRSAVWNARDVKQKVEELLETIGDYHRIV